jgi:hypothetical protein
LRLSQSGFRTQTAKEPKFIPPITSFVPPKQICKDPQSDLKIVSVSIFSC